MQVKLIAGDGCWKYENVPESLGYGEDIFTIVYPMAVGHWDQESLKIISRKRCYRFYSRDDHGINEYRELE